MLEKFISPLEKEGQNFIWFATDKQNNIIYECNDKWETKDFMTDVYGPRYFLNNIGLIGGGFKFFLNLDIMDIGHKLEENVFSYQKLGEGIQILKPRITLGKNNFLSSITTRITQVTNLRDDIFVRKYIHCDLKLVKTPNGEAKNTSVIDYYGLGYSNEVHLDDTDVRYTVMLCVPDSYPKNHSLFYKLQLTANMDSDIDIFMHDEGAFINPKEIEPSSTVSLKKGVRQELYYYLTTR